MNSEQPRVLPACAKINLCLDIRGRRPDGYHELDTVFQRLALHDTVALYPAKTGIAVTSDRPLPAGPKNIAYRAAELLVQEYGVRYGVRIRLRKRIPIAAGLGGGSADAATVLQGLPSIWGMPPLPLDRLLALARVLGADVPFCLLGVVTARAGGIGDVLEPLPDFTGYEVLLVKPAARLSTARVYAGFKLDEAVHPKVDRVVQAIRQGDLEGLGRLTGNVLEAPAMAYVPEIDLIKQVLRAAGAPVVLMTGSGPTVFALHREKGWAGRTACLVARPGWTVIATRTA